MRPLKHRQTFAGTGYHSGSHTSCTVILVLHENSHVGWTLASTLTRYVRSSRSGIVSSALGALICRAEYRSALLPILVEFPPIRLRLCFSFTAKGLMPLSSLSFSRSAFWAEPRRLSVSGPSVSPPRGSRRQRALNEPFEPFTRMAIVALVRVPPGDLRCSLHTAHPLWTRPTCRISAAGVSRSPVLLCSSAWDRISGLLSGWSPEDYSEKPPSNWTTHSRGNPALRDTNVTVGKLRPLSRMVSSV